MSAPTTQQLHGTAHPGGTTLVGVAQGGSTVQKIQLDKVEAPVVQQDVYKRQPAHKATGFDWWKRRMKHATSIYDVVRIDHFRGFERCV